MAIKAEIVLEHLYIYDFLNVIRQSGYRYW